MTQTATHRYIGITDEQTVCDRCGKVDLGRTVILVTLDADGNDDAVVHYGTTCAAKVLAVKGGSRKVRDLAEFATRETLANAEWAREQLAHYSVEADGTIAHRFGELGVAMDYECAHRNAMWAHRVTPAEWAERARDMITRNVKAIAEANLLAA